MPFRLLYMIAWALTTNDLCGIMVGSSLVEKTQQNKEKNIMTSSVVQGLGAIRKLREEQAKAREEANRPRANWISGKMTEKPFVARILQELDEDNEFYREDRGVGFIAVEHVSPYDFKRRALCSIESQGRCFGCESYRNDPNPETRPKWKQKSNLYIQVLADFGDLDKNNDGPAVYVFSRRAGSSFLDTLLSELEDEGNLTQANYRFTKTGQDTTTAFIIKRLTSEPLDDSNVEVFPRESYVREIEYEKQAEFYGAAAPKSAVPSSATDSDSDDDEW